MRRRLGAANLGGGREIDAMDRRGFGVGGAEMVGEGTVLAADVEDALRIVEGSVDDEVADWGGEGGGFRFEACELGGTGAVGDEKGMWIWEERMPGNYSSGRW